MSLRLFALIGRRAVRWLAGMWASEGAALADAACDAAINKLSSIARREEIANISAIISAGGRSNFHFVATRARLTTEQLSLCS